MIGSVPPPGGAGIGFGIVTLGTGTTLGDGGAVWIGIGVGTTGLGGVTEVGFINVARGGSAPFGADVATGGVGIGIGPGITLEGDGGGATRVVAGPGIGMGSGIDVVVAGFGGIETVGAGGGTGPGSGAGIAGIADVSGAAGFLPNIRWSGPGLLPSSTTTLSVDVEGPRIGVEATRGAEGTLGDWDDGRREPSIFRSLPPAATVASSFTGVAAFGDSIIIEIGGIGRDNSGGRVVGATAIAAFNRCGSMNENVWPVMGSRASISTFPSASIETFITVTFRSSWPGKRSVTVSLGRGVALATGPGAIGGDVQTGCCASAADPIRQMPASTVNTHRFHSHRTMTGLRAGASLRGLP